ncbi:OsmC family protein [Acidisphaera sp. L21]|uniref:OsmC family protein n=1 Tax=Acidisphaera sp. L21 TaxID=1641851 RepID=UPI00131E7D96|nr:OsmC family protein [Acidisphaera sp. L21]
MTHHYVATVEWTGNTGNGTATPVGYERRHDIRIAGKPAIAGSSDPSFRGDPACHNPEDLLVASVSACHMLWFLGLCAAAKVVVTAYEDRAEGFMEVGADGGGKFTKIVLRPRVTVSGAPSEQVLAALHHDAHAKCFIANSLNFTVDHDPETIWA